MFQCPEDVYQSVEELQYRLEELRRFCDDCTKRNQELQKVQIDKEKECQKAIKNLTEEIAKLRDMKMHILRENIMKGVFCFARKIIF